MLSETYTNQSRCLFFDYYFSYFSSIKLFDILLHEDTLACATIRYDRVEYPSEILKTDKDLTQHEHDFAQCDKPQDISVVKWKDHGEKAVSVISNMHNPSKTEHVLKTNPHGNRERVQCPAAVADYNRLMEGVICLHIPLLESHVDGG